VKRDEGGRREAEEWNRFAQSFLLNKMAENSKNPNNWRLILFGIWILLFGIYLPNFNIR